MPSANSFPQSIENERAESPPGVEGTRQLARRGQLRHLGTASLTPQVGVKGPRPGWSCPGFPRSPSGTATCAPAPALSCGHCPRWGMRAVRGQQYSRHCFSGTCNRTGRRGQQRLPAPQWPALTSFWGLHWVQSSRLGKTHTLTLHPGLLRLALLRPLVFCSFIPGLINTLALAQPLRAQSLANVPTSALRGPQSIQPASSPWPQRREGQ